MDYLTHNVALNLKQIRLSRGMSLDAAAEQTGVSKSMLSQIEKESANPSLAVLGKIANGLRIEVRELLEEPPMPYCLVKPEESMPIKEIEGQFKEWTCFPYEDNRQVEIYRIDIEPGGVYVSGAHGEKTREYLSVTEGTLIVECGGHTQRVEKNQVYRFETYLTHTYRNPGDEKLSFLCFFLDYSK